MFSIMFIFGFAIKNMLEVSFKLISEVTPTILIKTEEVPTVFVSIFFLLGNTYNFSCAAF